MSHIILITKLPDEHQDDYVYEIGGTHDSRCETWRSCRQHGCEAPNPNDSGDEEWEGHGVLHQLIDGEWMTADGGCGLTYAFEESDWQAELDAAGLGTHRVDADWDGDWWALSIAPEATSEYQTTRKDTGRHETVD